MEYLNNIMQGAVALSKLMVQDRNGRSQFVRRTRDFQDPPLPSNDVRK